MEIEKVNFYSGHFTPDSEKDSLESAHISEDEVMLVKNEKKILENQRMEEINEKVEEIDLTSNKEGMHINLRGNMDMDQPFGKGKHPIEQLIRKERKNSIYRKTA